jgi:hypothetical protein
MEVLSGTAQYAAAAANAANMFAIAADQDASFAKAARLAKVLSVTAAHEVQRCAPYNVALHLAFSVIRQQSQRAWL